eukprot:scaffold123493_cov25-Tisochrysis_lutea.AAC.6
MRSITPPASPAAPRAGASASISSKKRTQGEASVAREKSSRTCRSDSPTYEEMSSGPLTERKRSPHSLATALASKVLPAKHRTNGVGTFERRLYFPRAAKIVLA